MVDSASFQAPEVFFLQNNQWAISVPVATQSRSPLYQRSAGYGIPSVQIDGNDVLASYAVTKVALDEARGGDGPRAIEAMTYRMGAHTTSDDPTKRSEEHTSELQSLMRISYAVFCLKKKTKQTKQHNTKKTETQY